jgi:hypothetical protein
MSLAPQELSVEQEIRANALCHAMELSRQRGLATSTAPEVIVAADQFYNYLIDGTQPTPDA